MFYFYNFKSIDKGNKISVFKPNSEYFFNFAALNNCIMRKLFAVSLLVLLSLPLLGQTADQLKMLQSLSPDQIEKLKKQQFDANSIKYNNNKKNTDPTNKNNFKFSEELKFREQIEIDDQVNKTIYDSLAKEEMDKRINSVYGREIFSRKNLTFAPSINIPTPESYVLGSGDELNINIWGAAESEYILIVSPDGFINIEGVGMIQVGAMTIRAANAKIKKAIAAKYEGALEGDVHINISLGKIRTITVNVAGEAKVPGTYTLPSLATLFNALYVAGGVSDIGSVREINLIRGGKKVNTLDVYQYLINGDANVNVLLQDNDLIVVEPYINIVRVAGSVKRPMKYELKSDETVENLIKYCGGFNGEALKNNVAVTRSADGVQLRMFTVDKPGFGYFIMMDNDSTYVSRVMQKFANKVSITGSVWQEGDYQLKEGINTVKDLIAQAGGVTPYAFTGRALLYRLYDDGKREVVGVNVKDVLEGRSNVQLQANDSLNVYSQDFFNQEKQIVVNGEVNFADTIVYGAGMTLYDAITASGGFTLSASKARIEISRRVNDPHAVDAPDKIAEIFTFKVNDDLTLNDNSQQFALMPFDEIFVRQSPGYIDQRNVIIEGEVIFDGQYTLHNRVTRLTDMIERAGGLTKDAYVKGAYLRRQKTEYDLEREKSLSKLKVSVDKQDTLVISKEGLGEYYSVAIDLQEAVIHPNSNANLELKDGDKIVIPIFNNTVKISGAVYYPNTVGYVAGLRVNDYIDRAGGYSERARRKPFILYQNGMVAKRGKIIEPGSEIIVPFKPYVEPMSAGSWIGITNSIVSMAAMVTSLFK